MIDSLSRDSPPTSADGLHPFAEVGEGCSEPVGIAAADDEGRRPWTSPGTVCRLLTELTCEVRFRIEAPLETLADVQQQAGDQLLLGVLR